MMDRSDNQRRTIQGLPSPKRLYDPAFEHDSCGVGFVARLDARPDHKLVQDGVQVLVNLEHRGATGGDKSTGDGAGLLLQVPDAFLRQTCDSFSLPQSDRPICFPTRRRA